MCNWIGFLCFALVCPGLVGCTSPEGVSVERQWGDTMRRLNMVGFYPMTEDVQVGDVYLHAQPNDSDRRNVARFSLLRLGSAPRREVWAELHQQQTEDRFVIAPLPTRAAEDTTSPAATPRARAITPGTIRGALPGVIGHADDADAPVRLRRSAIPTLEVGRLTEAQLGAAGVFGNVGARLGLGASTQTALRITLRNVQEMSLDAWRVDNLLTQQQGGFLGKQATAEQLLFFLGQMRPDLLGPVCRGDVRRLEREEVEIRVVNRVIYAGGIDYSFSRNAEAALRVALDLTAALPGSTQSPAVPGAFSQVTIVGGAESGQPSSAQPPPQAAARRLSSLLSAVTGSGGADASRTGVTSTIAVGSFGNLALLQDFNRPIAVGAGSAVTFSYFRVLAGTAAMEQQRYREALGYCERFAGSTDRDALWRAMGLPGAPPADATPVAPRRAPSGITRTAR